ncbi:MAG: 3'-5' exonuclease [Bacteroidetes bacterium]|nr:3'-5' exonuclease [Bacteroidota bacterium]
MQINLSRPLAFFDLESTGLTIGSDRIIEISVLKLLPDGSKVTFTKKVNPEMPIPEVVTKLTGITNEDVVDAPKFAEIADELKEFLNNCDLAGYNSNKFDVPLLFEEFFRVGVPFDLTGRKLVDVQNIFHKMEQRTLAAAYKFYCEKDLINAHSAEADIIATYEILIAQLSRYKDQLEGNVDFLHKFTNMHNTVDLAGRMVYNDKGEEIINFGKHKGKLVTDVFAAEPSYYDWLMKGDFPRQSKDAFTAIMERHKESKMEAKMNLLQQKFGQKS